jgi:hypothetical protein
LAIEAYRDILKISPGDSEALLSIAVHLSHLQKHEEALKTLAELLQREPQHITCLLTKGQIQAHIGRREEAAATFRSVLTIDSENDLAWVSYANVAAVSENPGKVVEIYRRLSRSHPEVLAYWRALGHALADKEHSAKAAAPPSAHGSISTKAWGRAARKRRYRNPFKQPSSEVLEMSAPTPMIEAGSVRTMVDNLRIQNERLGKLIAQQHRWLGFLDSHLTAVRYGHTSYYLRNMALFVEKFGGRPTYPSASPQIPLSLMPGFSMNGRVPVEYGYFNGCYPQDYVDTVTDDDIERSVAILRLREPAGWLRRQVTRFIPIPLSKPQFTAMALRAYSPYDHTAVNKLCAAFKKRPIQGQEILVYGARGIFYESLCVWGGARPTAIRPLTLVNRSSQISVRKQAEWEMNPSTYDCALAVNIGQEGLGAFGQPLDPDGDIKAMRRLTTMVKPGGSLFLVIPLGVDRLHFNLSRIYGRQRLPSLLEGWEIIDRRDVSDTVLNGGGKTLSLLVLRNLIQP